MADTLESRMRGFLHDCVPGVAGWYQVHDYFGNLKQSSQRRLESYVASHLSDWPKQYRCLPLPDESPFGWKSPFYTPPITEIEVEDKHLLFKHVQCVDGNGTIFESYNQLRVPVDVATSTVGRTYQESLGGALHLINNTSGFLPSSALHTNLMLAAFCRRGQDPSIATFLWQNCSSNHPWHITNTLIHYGGPTATCVHYPNALDNRHYMILTEQDKNRVSLHFPIAAEDYRKRVHGLRTCNISKRLDRAEVINALHAHTGLSDPTLLIPLANYFGKEPFLWVPQAVTKKATNFAFIGGMTKRWGVSARGGNHNTGVFQGVEAF